MVLDVAIVGAGIAGLTAARQLQRAGLRVALLDKSRGLGGRLATRRLPEASAGPTHGDHGVCYLKSKVREDDRFRQELENLRKIGLLRPWPERLYQLNTNGRLSPQNPTQAMTREGRQGASCYASSQGITAVAKHLGQGLTVHRQRRAVGLEEGGTGGESSGQSPGDRLWQITTASTARTLASETESPLIFQARQLILALPTPQAIALLSSLPSFDQLDPEGLAQLRSVGWSRCITAIATYPAPVQSQAAQLPWQGIQCPNHPELGWIGLDSSKQLNSQQPVVIVQSSDRFAQAQFEAAAQPGPQRQTVGQRLLALAAAVTEPWIAHPEALQVHRWGYAFAQTPLTQRCLSLQTKIPLWLAGDWCGGNRVESAYLSGLAVAEQLLDQAEASA